MMFCLTGTHRQGEFQQALWNFWELLLAKMDKIQASCQEDNKTWHDRVAGMQTWLYDSKWELAGWRQNCRSRDNCSKHKATKWIWHGFYMVREK